MCERSKRNILWYASRKRSFGIAGMLLAAVILISNQAMAAEAGETKSAGGLTLYLGVVPSELIKDPSPHSTEPPMQGGRPHGMHEHQIVVTVYDSATNTESRMRS